MISSMTRRPFRLEPSFREKIWGSTRLSPWFPDSDKKIGEVWFTGNDIPILVKFLFTTDRLSVQVHPDDDYAREHDNSPGKTEMWYILRADPGAGLALGFHEKITRERLRESAVTGEIERLLKWFTVKPGEAYFTPPGTVHAIGPGLALVEIQENSDMTYRLYDYGRPRDLHLDKATAVSIPAPHPGPSIPNGRTLVTCKYFATELWELASALDYHPAPDRLHLLITLEGAGALGDQRFSPGECWLIPAGAERFQLSVDGKARLLRTYVP